MGESGTARREQRLTGMSVSWGNLGLHLMMQPFLLPGPNHIGEWDPLSSNREKRCPFRRCSQCGTVTPILNCECGKWEVFTADRFVAPSSPNHTESALVPEFTRAVCSECYGDGATSDEATSCPCCGNQL